MGFSPVKRIGHRQYPTQMQTELADRLRRLSELPPACDTPYLTVSLDWRPEGSGPEYRGGMQRFEQESNRLHRVHWPRGPMFDSIGQDIERIREYLENELDPAAQGVFIVSNSGEGVFEAMALGIPLENVVTAGSIPALLPLARLDEDHPTYAVLVADQQTAQVSLIAQSRRVEMLRLVSSDYPRKQQTGGWSQRRFQQRADERLMALGRQIATETLGYLDDRGVDSLIIAGDEVITGTLDRVMPGALRDRVVETIRLDVNATEQEILDATMPIAERAERRRESEAVRTVLERRGMGKGFAAGSADVLEALVNGQVDVLVMAEDFHEDGWADFANGRYGAGAAVDVFGTPGDDFDAYPVEIEQEIVRLAVGTGAEIDIIHAGVPIHASELLEIPVEGQIPRSVAATRLDKIGGVAALLRY